MKRCLRHLALGVSLLALSCGTPARTASPQAPSEQAVEVTRSVQASQEKEPAEPDVQQEAGTKSSACTTSEPPSTACLCERGDHPACLRQTDLLFSQQQEDVAIIQAIALCHGNVGTACLRAAHYLDKLGIQRRLGTDATQLRARGFRALDDACTQNDAHACFQYGRALFRGKFLEEDSTRAEKLVTRACDGGAGIACGFLAGSHEAGQYLKKDKRRARSFLEKACNAGHASSCTTLGDKSNRRTVARSLFERACAGNDLIGCKRIARILNGEGKTQEAANTFLTICDLEIAASDLTDAATACVSGAKLLARVRDNKRASESYLKACELGHNESCTDASRFLTLTLAEGKISAKEGATSFLKICDSQHDETAAAKACLSGAKLLANVGDKRASESYWRACQFGHHESCVHAGRFLELNITNEKSPSGARTLQVARARYQDACGEGVGSGCFALASMVAAGRGGERHWGRALALYEEACSLGVTKGCTVSKELKRSPPNSTCKNSTECEAECKEGIGKACRILGEFNASEEAVYMLERQADNRRHQWNSPSCNAAARLYNRACDIGDGVSCLRSGMYAEACQAGEQKGCVLHQAELHDTAKPRKAKRILRSLQTLCAQNNLTACIALSRLLVQTNAKTSLQILRKLCDKGEAQACYGQAMLLERASVSCINNPALATCKRTVQASRALLRKACELGDLHACNVGGRQGYWRSDAGIMAKRDSLLRFQSCGRAPQK